MRIWEKIKTASYKIATIGGLGKWKLGILVASLIAFPLIFALDLIGKINGALLLWSLILIIILFGVIINFALRVEQENVRETIVLDKVLGLIIAFLMVPLRWRVMIFGFVLFYIFNTIKIPTYYKIVSKLEKLPWSLGVIIPDVLTGLCVNLFLQIMIWALG
jgi:phosphatidylglycerophosphatase A